MVRAFLFAIVSGLILTPLGWAQGVPPTLKRIELTFAMAANPGLPPERQ